MKIKKNDLYGYGISIAIAELTGLLAQLFSNMQSGFFSSLEKPPLSPPGWLFPVVWTLLYALMGIAAYRVYNSKAENKAAALVLYGLQLFVNFLWPVVFFRFQNIGAAMAVLILLLVLVVLTTVQFIKIDRLAGVLLLPYLLWLSFALYLNIGLYFLNM